MATTTTNLGLTKPSQDDFYDVDIFNANADKVDSALKVINTTATITAASWTGTSAPYSVDVSNASITGSAREIVGAYINPSATLAQMQAWNEAGFIGGTNTAGKITLKAIGKKPTIDIPISLTIRG